MSESATKSDKSYIRAIVFSVIAFLIAQIFLVPIFSEFKESRKYDSAYDICVAYKWYKAEDESVESYYNAVEWCEKESSYYGDDKKAYYEEYSPFCDSKKSSCKYYLQKVRDMEGSRKK